MKIQLFNTLGRKLNTLEPLIDNLVRVYCCGPTVYNYQHIGNLRTYVFEDVLVRTLRYAGYQVKHVMNITDVGHLVSDADEGEDKMLLAAKREGKSSYEIADYYTKIFLEHCDWLNIKRPDVICKATEHIPQMIAMIEQLIKNGHAYLSGGNVYYDIQTAKDYGKLSGHSLEAQKPGARIEIDSNKRNPQDFALWFTKSKFEQQEMKWDSPWGLGYPGWHIECSAMSICHLGETFDIHCGGIDHIPVHHTNEILQSEGASGKEFCKIWMHGNFLVVSGDKMSKSSGEFLTLDLLQQKGFNPLSYRLFCYTASYRQELNWSFQSLESAEASLKRLQNAVHSWREELGEQALPQKLSSPAEKLRSAFTEAICNDLNMPRAMAVVHEVKDSSLSAAEKLGLFFDFEQVLGLGIRSWKKEEVEIPSEVQALLEQREQARAARDFKRADELRDSILALGFLIEDSKDGARLKRKS